jgi:hypothetical protein
VRFGYSALGLKPGAGITIPRLANGVGVPLSRSELQRSPTAEAHIQLFNDLFTIQAQIS